MSNENSENRFWKTIERYKLIIEIIVAIPTATGVIWATWIVLKKGLQATVPAWVILLVSLCALLLGITIGRRSNPKHLAKKIKREEAFDAIWEINQTNDEVDGPFCKTCYTRMEPVQKKRPADDSIYLIFACHNPSCERRGAITSGLVAANIDDAKRKATEYFDGQKRKKLVTKK